MEFEISRSTGDALTLRRRFFPEANIGGVSHVDSGVAFYTQINAILRPEDRVLDFGAGRGEHIVDEQVKFRRNLFNLQGRCAHVEGVDLDAAVLSNPYLDHAAVMRKGDPLPYADNSFDIVVSRFVFEHIDDPDYIAAELLRVVKPGGIIAALTPNKYGYIALAGRSVPNRLHVKWLRAIQPNRKSVDVFPTTYLLNTPRALNAAFGAQADIYVSYIAGEPAYYFGNVILYRLTNWIHKHLPDRLQPLNMVFICKR
ncbi:class I SAM-dependent methyltransferase [Mycolicibacterium parafortuitum]|uniref:class I SAM-dependent methyltransferase n=1 Tax=Mycolicibacterium parafortuitum TaxID=39692 RepID=UPI001E3DBE50|nr:class I SAM-dependent methyltransferase [Mycolicibacterium parafortuitum]